MILTLIRHGETQANRRRLYYGVTDLPLLPESVRALRENAKNYPAAAHYYTSGMLRTEQTFAAIYGDTPHEALAGLREMDFGDFEMHSYEELKLLPAYQAWIADVEHTRCPNGESPDEVRARALAAAEPLILRGEDCVCVTHGGVIAALMTAWFGGTRYDHTPAPGGGFRVAFCGGRPAAWEPLFEKKTELRAGVRP